MHSETSMKLSLKDGSKNMPKVLYFLSELRECSTYVQHCKTRVVRRQRSSPERADCIRKQSLNIKV